MSASESAEPVTILLVEDHAQLRAILIQALTTMGYRVMFAGTGDEALQQLIDGAAPDLLFSDIRMPGHINGVDLVRWVGAHLPACRILLQTGYSHLDPGGHQVLRKPFTLEALSAAVQAALA